MAQIAEAENEFLPVLDTILAKKAEGRPLTPEEMIRWHALLTVWRAAELPSRYLKNLWSAKRKFELRSKFPERIFDQNILDSGLSDHVNNLLQEAGYLMVGDLAIQVRTDPDLIYKINGIGPKALAEITNLIDSLEAEMAPVVEEDVEEEPVETETALERTVQEAASETTAIEEEVAEVVNEPVVEEVDPGR